MSIRRAFVQRANTVSAFVSSKVAGKNRILGYLERAEGNLLEGWVIDRRGGDLTLELRIGNESFPVKPQWHDRADVSSKHGRQHAKPGFRVKVEDVCWQTLSHTGAQLRDVTVVANGIPLTSLLKREIELKIPRLDLRIQRAGIEGAIEGLGFFS